MLDEKTGVPMLGFRSRAEGHGLDAAVAAWIRSFAQRGATFGTRAVWVTDFDLETGFVRSEQGWQVRFQERGGPLTTLMTGEREHVQRYFVWRLASTAQAAAGRTHTEYPVAPERVAATGGPLHVRDGPGHSGEVWAEGRRVAVLESRSEAVEFTHYGWLPVELLIAQITSPAEDMVFPAGARYRTDEEQTAEAERIRRGALALLAASG